MDCIGNINEMYKAEMYDLVQYSRQGKDGMDLIQKLPLRRGMQVLDLGCGTGYLASIIAKEVGETGSVIAVDPDVEKLQIARKKYNMLENITFLEGSSEHFPDGPHGVVFSNHVLHSIKDKYSVFKSVFDHLGNDGYFAFSCCTSLPSSVWEIVTPMPDQTDYLCPTDVYDSLVSKFGFVVEYSSVDDIVYTFDNVDL